MTDHRTYYYARVSSKDQHLDRQLAAFRALGAQEREIITDKDSGKDMERPGYTALKTTILRPGDTLVVTSLDRLSRSKADIRAELDDFRRNHIRLKVLDLPTTMTDFPPGQEWVAELVNNIIIEVLGTMAERERIATRQRQAEGYAAAKAAGRKMGRPVLQKPEGWDEVYAAWQGGELTATQAMQRLGLKSSTFYRLAGETEKNK